MAESIIGAHGKSNTAYLDQVIAGIVAAGTRATTSLAAEVQAIIATATDASDEEAEGTNAALEWPRVIIAELSVLTRAGAAAEDVAKIKTCVLTVHVTTCMHFPINRYN